MQGRTIEVVLLFCYTNPGLTIEKLAFEEETRVACMAFKRYKFLAVITALSMMIFPAENVSADELPTTLYETTTEQILAKGLTYEHKEKLTDEGWVNIHVLKMDVNEPTLSLDVIRNQALFAGKDGLSDMLDQDENAVGGINASFFSMGSAASDIEGTEIDDQTVGYARDAYNTTDLRAASLIEDTNGSITFDFISTEISFITERGVDVYVIGVNSIGDFNNPVIFNKEAFDDTSTIDAVTDLYKVVVDAENKVIAEIGPDEVVVIPDGGYVLVMNASVGPSVFSKIRIGDEATLSIDANIELSDIETAISGGGFILRDGETVEEGLIVSKDGRNPRTAVGMTSDGQTLIAMVVDGRGESIGATHAELAEYLKEYDVKTAIHYDGGGSSTLSAKTLGNFEAESMNTPSGGYERPIVNGLGFVSNAPETSDYKLYLTASQSRAFINNQIELELKAYDLNYNPVEVDQSNVAWGMSGGFGAIDDMVFTPQEAGDVRLTAYYQGRSTSIELAVSENLIDLEIEPKFINYSDGQQTFTVVGTDSFGYKSIIDSELLTWELSENIGTINNGIFVPGEASEDARIDVTYNGIKEVAYVVTGEKVSPLVNLDALTVESLVYPETVTGDAKTEIVDGKNVIAIDYDFVSTDFAQAVYAVLPDIKIGNQVDQLRLTIDEWPEGVQIKGHITDANDEQFTLTFSEGEDDSINADLPKSLVYPITIKRFYVVAVGALESYNGTLRISQIETVTKKTASDLDEIISIAPEDPLIDAYPEEGFDIRIFGATGGRNRLLDEVVLGKVYDVLNASDYAIYAGKSVVDESKITNDHIVYNNTFSVTDLEQTRIITLAMGNGGMVNTDPTQWIGFDNAMTSTVQDTLIILGTERLIDNTDSAFTREGELMHTILRDFCKKSGKKVFYINASGYQSKLDLYEGVRYIDLNGLWYKVDEDHEVDLYDSFQTLTINFAGNDVTYNMEDLYPKTTVQQ